MSTNFSPVETGVPRWRYQFRSSCKLLLNLFRDTENSLPFTPEPPLTPVCNLIQGFRNGSTLAGDTPRRRLDLSNLSNGEEETAFYFSPSPGTLEAAQKNLAEPQDNLDSRRQCAQLLQAEVQCSTPGILGCSHQVDCGVNSPSMNKENESNFLKYPGWQMPRSLLFQKKPPATHLICCAAAPERGSLEEYEMKDLGSPVAALATQRIREALDGFPELCPEELEEIEKPLAGHPSSMAVLLSGPLLSQDINVNEDSVNKNRLFRSPSLPEKLSRPTLKLTVKNHGDETPMKAKQKHSPVQEQSDGVGILKKTASFSDIEIVRALDQDFGHRHLIGDFSNVFALPTVMGRHQDLRYITSQTMAALLQNQFQSLIEKFCIIDCRYPYEYHGGHIKGALNIHRQDDLFERFLRKPFLPSAPQKHLILVFHCEFSSERGPKMCRYLREEDRAMNEYPTLHYPELYVLQGGYKDFFQEYKELCEPQSYCPMHHQDFKEEMLRFRVRSKTWAGERKRRDQIAHIMKL
ncbi:M-phase inducer phosphatase 3 isoform X2 [Sphaerodactylus townsendi]|uniref:M-phase inducer phosphatase 3 isoform X2 n=1 Tax=Sphaerodactylus townsendi TaxID=933632 RepID=UPI002026ED1A|nr:M-phase inducer phosphatase 3 isoform X2 [Sphaerodactylus townsendi]